MTKGLAYETIWKMSEENKTFEKEDLASFESWLGLNKAAVTWQGRFEKEFNSFWEEFLTNGLSINQYFSRFNYAFIHVKRGPLSSWFSWLRDSFICYIFIFKGMSIREIGNISGIDYDCISIILRDFYISFYPEFDEEISNSLQVVNILSPNIDRTLEDLYSELVLDGREKLGNSSSLLQNMEVTLYDEWKILSARMKKDFASKSVDFEKLKVNLSFKKQIKALRDIVLISAISAIVIVGTKKINIYWENNLLEKISIYEPQFKWLDKTLLFEEKDVSRQDDFKLDKSDLEKVETSESKFDDIDFNDEARYETESEVTLTSWDSLPKDFDVAGLEQSGYEELKKRGYRDSRYGSTKVYRVMMKSVDSESAKEKLTRLLKKYEVTQVDNVKPGKEVPGGVYYNLYVPRKFLKEFMSQVMEVDDSMLYESRTTSGRNPPGMNKVFVWIKNI